MSNDVPRNALSAKAEILRLALQRILAGKVSWQNDENDFYGYIGDDLVVVLDGTSRQLVDSKMWDRVEVREGDKEIVKFYYPSLSNKIQGLQLVPEEFQPKLDSLFESLLVELIDNKYGPALRKLKALK